jgi:Tfp pilus assembly protein PilN
MSPAKKDVSQLVIGGEPRIDFLPLEIKQRKANRRSRRSLVFLVLVIFVICIGGYVAATGLAASSQAELDTARSETARLLAEQGKYSEAQSVATDRDAARAAAKVGSGNEILWKNYLAELVRALPADTDISKLEVDSLGAQELSPATTVPLEKPRVSTITFTVETSSISRASQLVEILRQLPGFADATITGLTKVENEPQTADVVLHINSDAFERRLLADLPETDPDAADTDTTTEDQG